MTTPAYYQRSGRECRQLSTQYPHEIASAIEYVWRHKGKGGVSDLYKALDWLNYWPKTRPLQPATFEQSDIICQLIDDTHGPERRYWTALDNGDLPGMKKALHELIEEEQ